MCVSKRFHPFHCIIQTTLCYLSITFAVTLLNLRNIRFKDFVKSYQRQMNLLDH